MEKTQLNVCRPALWYPRTCRLQTVSLHKSFHSALEMVVVTYDCLTVESAGSAEQPPSFQEDGGHAEQPQTVLGQSQFTVLSQMSVTCAL